LNQPYGKYKGLTQVNETIEHLVDIKTEKVVTENEGDADEDLVSSDEPSIDSVQDSDEATVQSTEDRPEVPIRQSRELVGLRAYNAPGRREFVEFSFMTTLEDEKEPEEPSTFEEAWWHPDPNERKHWREAIKKEFHDMIVRGVWRKVKVNEMPEGRRAIGNKWIYKKKKNGVYRARLVALGYSQVPGVDFFDNYSPVVNDVTFRTVMVMMVVNSWYCEIIDVETAFLYGDLKEEIYMKTPKGLEEVVAEDYDGHQVLLLKTIYGLVQAAREFWKKIVKSLKDLNFKPCQSDSCLLFRTDKNGTVILCIYVDDICCVGDEKAVKIAIDEIEALYKIKHVGELQEYVGVTVEKRQDGSIVMSQPDTITKIQKKFGKELELIKQVKSPAAASDVVMRPQEESEKINDDKQGLYRSGVGMLLWLTKHTRPDIANAVRESSKVMDGATEAHYKYMLRICKYVVDTDHRKLIFNPKERSDDTAWSMQAYCDSDYSGDRDTRKSVSGYLIYFMGCLVAWRSRSQKSVTLSSTEAEYVACSEAATEIVFIRNLLEFLGLKIEYPILLNIDNIGAIYMAENATSSKRTKHVDTRWHYVRNWIEDGIIKVIFVRTAENQSDPFTKNLAVEPFLKHTGEFMFDDVVAEGTDSETQSTGRMLKGVSEAQSHISQIMVNG
jgi:hypothetical protein